MSNLSIGELTGYVDLDDSGMEQGAKRGESAVAKMTGDVLGHLAEVEARKAQVKLDADATRLRTEIKQVDAQLRDLVSKPTTAQVIAQTDQAAAHLNDLHRLLAKVEGQRAVIKIDADTGPAESEVKKLGATISEQGKTIGLVGGAAIGAAAAVGISETLTIDAAQHKLAAQLGGSARYAGEMGALAGELYANAYGGSLTEVGDALRMVVQSGALMEDASTEQIKAITGQALSLAQVFDADVSESMRAVGQLVRTEMVSDAQHGMNLITAAFQQLGPGADDILDNLTEYSTQFRKIGIDGEQALGMIVQMVKAGAYSTDVAGDALKEFAIRAVDGSKTTIDGFTAIGLNADEMSRKFAAGGQTASDAFKQVIDHIAGMQDPLLRSSAIVNLFGTQAEDLGDALFAIDPSRAEAALGPLEGLSEKVDQTAGEAAQNKVTMMQRAFDSWAASIMSVEGPIGTAAAATAAFGGPALQMAGNIGMIALAAGPFSGTLLGMAKTTVTSTGAMLLAIVKWSAGTAAQGTKAVASMTVTAAQYVLKLGVMTAATAKQTGVMIGHLIVWVAGLVAQGAKALVSLAVTAVAYVAQWTMMAAGAMARAAVMAAAWFVALGPIGWAIAAIIGIAALIFANWDKIKEVSSAVWSAIWDFLKQVWQWIWDWIDKKVAQIMGIIEWFKELPGKAAEYFGGLKDAAIREFVELIAWAITLPDKLMGAIGDLKDILVNAGKDFVMGLWRGIENAASWLKNKIMGWIRAVVPGPILQFLGIHSESKWARDEVGRWLGPGLATGITSNSAPAIQAAMTLARTVGEALRSGMARASAGVDVVQRWEDGSALLADGRVIDAETGQVRPRGGGSTPDLGELTRALEEAVRSALHRARLEVDGRGVARLVHKSNAVKAVRGF